MSEPNFEQVGSLWRRHNREEEHLVGKMKRGNLIFKVRAYPNRKKTCGDDPDFYLLMDEGEIDKKVIHFGGTSTF